MGLFSNKPRYETCEMCGKVELEGCGSVHKHVVEISGDQPAWLPPNLRAQAQGEFTWQCIRCNSFPAMKWPSSSGAWAGMMLHLGSIHRVGHLQGVGQQFDMITVP